MKKPQLRPADYSYTVCYQDPYFHAGVTALGEQVLCGIQLPRMVALFFDSSGDLLRVDQREYSFKLAKRPDGSFFVDDGVLKQMGKDLKVWESEMKFGKGRIHVKRFSLPKLYIAVRDLPDHYEEFLATPSDFEEERRSELQGDIDEWFREGSYVLQWNEVYDMDKKGRVVGS